MRAPTPRDVLPGLCQEDQEPFRHEAEAGPLPRPAIADGHGSPAAAAVSTAA